MPNFVLMVDTLWLWILDDATIVSFAPRREKDKGNFPKKFSHHEADPVLELLHSLKRERKWEINDCFDLAALLIYYSVDTLLKGPVGSSVQVLRAFEGFASDKVNSMTKTYKTFRKTQKFENTQFDIEDDLNNTIELRDITDEIEILLKLIGEQLKLVQDIKTKYETQINKEEKRGRKGVAFLHFAEERLHSYQEQLIDLKKSTSQARDSYTELINLKESHSAVRQSRIVNIFTLVTIIFSPLSFFAGIFGMVSFKYVHHPIDHSNQVSAPSLCPHTNHEFRTSQTGRPCLPIRGCTKLSRLCFFSHSPLSLCYWLLLFTSP